MFMATSHYLHLLLYIYSLPYPVRMLSTNREKQCIHDRHQINAADLH